MDILSWTGLGPLAFHILLAAVVFWAVWKLLGRGDFALIVAAAALFCPGYVRWQKILDPNDITVLFGFPYAALVVSLLKKPVVKRGALLGLFMLTMGFTSLNWTSAWVFGPFALLLLGLPQINRRMVVMFIALIGICSFLFVLASIAAKTGGGTSGRGNASLGHFISSYTWGDVGYGKGLTTGKALLRLSFQNGIGLLPVLLIWGYTTVKNFGRLNRNIWLAVSPFGLTVVEVGFLRNYFGQHPWMASPLLLMGLIFSLVLLRTHVETDVTRLPVKTTFIPAIVPACFGYGLAVLIFFRANEANQLSLVSLVRHHTQRSDCVVILKGRDPQTAQMAQLITQLPEVLDRRVVVADDLKHLPPNSGNVVILTAVPSAGVLKLLAQTGIAGESKSWTHKIADWFNRDIARRRHGDRLELADHYYLYSFNPPPAKGRNLTPAP
ncbi:MAG TPA: hypothetical protein VFY06_05430 [Verrucomicrobiae bacterium]|nr:hypothetical protein [Verrucomicrobiae bacterium]